jgi:hypothetical protein
MRAASGHQPSESQRESNSGRAGNPSKFTKTVNGCWQAHIRVGSGVSAQIVKNLSILNPIFERLEHAVEIELLNLIPLREMRQP